MTKYWVGGSGSWNESSHWATGSGGAGGTGVPTASDDVVFDSNSGASPTITITASSVCLDLTVSAPTSGDITFSGSGTFAISGSMTLYSGMTWSHTGTVTFNSTSTGKTITTAGVSIGGGLSFAGTGGEWTLQDALEMAGTLSLTRGSLVTNNHNVTTDRVQISGSIARSISLGSSTVTITGSNGWSVAGSNFTIVEGTSTIVCEAGGFAGANETYATVQITSSSNVTISGANTFGTLTLAPSGGYPAYVLTGNQTVTGTCTISGNNSSSQRLLVRANSPQVVITITAATVSITNVDFRDITGAGAGSWSGTSIGDCGGNSGITFTSPVTRYWVHPGGASESFTNSNWSSSSGGATGASVPLPHDTAIFDANSFAATGKTVSINISLFRLPAMDWTGATNSPTLSFDSSCELYGSITLISGMAVSGTASMTLRGRGSHTITSAGNSWTNGSIGIDCVSGTYTLQDAFTLITASNSLGVSSGNFSAATFNVTAGTFSGSGTSERTIGIGSGTWELNGIGVVWNTDTTTNLTITGSGTIKLTNNSASTKTFSGGGATFPSFWNATSGAGVVNHSGSNTWTGDFKVDPGRTNQFTAGTTTTAASWTLTGSSGNVITIGSITAASHTLAKIPASGESSTGQVSGDWLSISRSTCLQPDCFYAGTNSTDGGNNVRWIFTAPVDHTARISAMISRPGCVTSHSGNRRRGSIISRIIRRIAAWGENISSTLAFRVSAPRRIC